MALMQKKPGSIEDSIAQRLRAKPAASLASVTQPKVTTAAADPYGYRSKPWQEQLGAFQNDSALAQKELERATKQRDLYKALGQNDKLASADKWIGQLHTVTGNSLMKTPDNKMDGVYEQLSGLLKSASAKPDPFTYDPNKDILYQNALQQAQRGAQTATNNALVSLGSRGIGNSSSAVTAANQIQQSALADVNSRILPQLMNQAEQRHLNEQNTQRQAILDRLGIIDMQSGLIGREQDNAYRDQVFDRGVLESERSFDRGVLESDRAFDFQQGRAQRQDFESDRGFNRGVLESDRSFNRGVLESDRAYNQNAQQFAARQGLDWAQLTQREKEFVADEAWKQKNYDLDVQREYRLGQEDNGSGNASQIRETAIQMAQDDPDWADPIKRNQLITYYINMITGNQAGPPAPGGASNNAPAVTDEDIMKYLR